MSETTSDRVFTAACVQLASDIEPEANVKAVLEAIRSARDAGADFVLTPETTDMMEMKRRDAFAKIKAGEDTARKAYRRSVDRAYEPVRETMALLTAAERLATSHRTTSGTAAATGAMLMHMTPKTSGPERTSVMTMAGMPIAGGPTITWSV